MRKEPSKVVQSKVNSLLAPDPRQASDGASYSSKVSPSSLREPRALSVNVINGLPGSYPPEQIFNDAGQKSACGKSANKCCNEAIA